MNNLISVIILGYNSKKYLKWCFDSVLTQTHPNLEIIFVDNASTDDSIEFVEQYITRTKKQENKRTIRIIMNRENFGYTGGNNIGIKASNGEFILCLNPDIILDKNYIKNIINLFQKNPKIGAAAGKLLKFKFHNNTIEKTNIIDSCGFKIFKSHRVIEQGGGEIDKGQYDITAKVFGVSGAAPILRKSALDNICKHLHKAFVNNSHNYFDNDFFAYKEDVDLAFRIMHAGCESWFEPKAIAWHHRWETGTRDDEKSKDIISRRRKRSKFVNYFSYRNHLYFLLKNEFFVNLLLYSPWITIYELKKLIFGLFFEKEVLRGLHDFAKNLSLTITKRRDILSKSAIKPKDIRKWLV